MKFIILLLSFFTLISLSRSYSNSEYLTRIHNERYYQDYFADSINAKSEVYMSDRTRLDIMTDEFAIEVDFANKWAESIGQSLHYASLTGLKPAVLLIVEDIKKDKKYLDRLVPLCYKLDIKLYVIYSNLNTKEIKPTLTY